MHAISSLHNIIKSRRIAIGKVGIDALDLEGALLCIDHMIHSGDVHYICFCESNLFVQADRNSEIQAILERADLVFPDGVFLMQLAKAIGRPLPQRLPGPSMMLSLCEYGLSRGYRHYFYGGADGVPERLAENLNRKFPGLQIVGTYSPPFRPLTPEEEQEVKTMIENAAPDLLWVGLGAPKQEFWISSHLATIQVPLMLGVGAAFDFHAGTAPWAPYWVRLLGLEWGFRMLTGGRRVFLRNIKCVTIAFMVLIRELFKHRFASK